MIYYCRFVYSKINEEPAFCVDSSGNTYGDSFVDIKGFVKYVLCLSNIAVDEENLTEVLTEYYGKNGEMVSAKAERINFSSLLFYAKIRFIKLYMKAFLNSFMTKKPFGATVFLDTHFIAYVTETDLERTKFVFDKTQYNHLK